MPDVIVIGLGALGSAAAYWAARRGLTVLGLERFAIGHDRGASEDRSRIIRRTYPTPEYLRFAEGAFDAWAAVEADAGERLVLRTGGLDLFPAGCVDDLHAYERAMGDAGIGFERLDPGEAMRRWPAWQLPSDVEVLFQPDAGVVAASPANATHRRLALERGARLLGESVVIEIVPTGGGFEVRTAADTHRARAVVVTADAWTNELLAPLGLSFPLRVSQEQVTYYDAPDPSAFEPDAFPVWIWHSATHVYGLPSFGGPGPKVALHAGGSETTPDTRTFQPDPGYAERVDAFVEEYLPSAMGPKLDVKTCQYTQTPDQDFVLDRLPGFDGIAIGLGSAHAFKFASVFGRALVELAVDGGSPWAVPRFSATRPALTDDVAAS